MTLGYRECKRKSSSKRTWANFKKHFAYEVKEHHKEQGDTAKEHYVANSTQQIVLDARSKLQDLANTIIKEFKDTMEDNT